MKSYQRKICCAIGFPTGIENLGEVFEIWLREGVGAWVNTWGEHGEGLKMAFLKSLKNTWEGVHLLKLSVISLQACNFTKNQHLQKYFSRILARFKLLFIVFYNSKNTFQSNFQWLLLLVLVITNTLVYLISCRTWLAYFTKYAGLEMVMKHKEHTFYINYVFSKKHQHLRPWSHYLSLNIHTGNTISTLCR